MSVRGRVAGILSLMLLASAPVRAQQVVIDETENLAFDRPEAWGMKYYASLGILTSMGAPERRAPGEVVLGFEGATVPQLSDEERRLGFNGTKLEDVNGNGVASRNTAVARPRPSILRTGSSPNPKPTKTDTMIAAPHEIVRAVTPIPRTTA